jgi:hypothetical protein
MILAVAGAILMQGASTVTSTDSAGNHVDWIAVPKAQGIAECMRSTIPAFDLVLLCRTAAGDRLEGCLPDPDRPQPQANVAKFAVCTAKGYRVRATDQSGKRVTGTDVRVPIHLRSEP